MLWDMGMCDCIHVSTENFASSIKSHPTQSRDNNNNEILIKCEPLVYTQAWELYAHRCTCQLSSQHAPRYIQYAPRLWVKKKIWNCLCASFRFGIGWLVFVVLMNPLASESALFLDMHNAVLDRPFWFLNTRYQCDAALLSKLTRLTEPTSFDVMAAYAIKIF